MVYISISDNCNEFVADYKRERIVLDKIKSISEYENKMVKLGIR